MFSTMVDRNKLLDILLANRANHRQVFENALKNYRQDVIIEVHARIDQFLSGKAMRILVNLPIPEDHTEDYDSIIGLLSMSTDPVVEVDATDYKCFVLDQWQWTERWASNTLMYNDK
jgi:hypothetical protein